MKYHSQLRLVLQSMLASMCMLLFLYLMFTAMNNTQSAISGEQLRLYTHQEGLVIDLYGKGYLIDFSPFEEFKQQLAEHWELIPRPIRLVQGVQEFIQTIVHSFV